MKTEESGPDSSRPPRMLVLAAFAAIYVIWGSTYLGIRYAVESLPPFLMGGARFVIAGAVLYAVLRRRGVSSPARADWVRAGISGLLLLGLGNGGVNWAEQKVPSSLAALIIAGTPIWFAVFDWLRPGGLRPTARTLLGIFVGFLGVAVLIGNRHDGSGNSNWIGVLALMMASISWAGGSLYTKYSTRAKSTLMAAAQQMLAGGAIMFVMGFMAGEAETFRWANVSARSLWAFGYLTAVGSLVGFTAYSWLLTVTTPARVSTYAYVNPVIAVFVGCFIGGEPLTTSMLVAAGIIVFAVIVLTTKGRAGRAAPAPPRTSGGKQLHAR